MAQMMGGRMRRGVAALAMGLAAAVLAAPAQARAPRVAQISFHKWTSANDFRSGTIDGTSLVIGNGAGLRLGPITIPGTDPDGRFNGHSFESGTWTGPWFRPGFGFDELVASWHATTPSGP